ncbi:MAG: hypothetical protein WCV50_05110 [Patescibacteria group bacterium]|jgi:hypothetical protein
MIDLKNTTRQKLLEPEFAKRVFSEAYDYVRFVERRTYQLAEFLDKTLQIRPEGAMNELERSYSLWISKLRFAGLQFYSEKEVESFFEQRIYDALGSEDFDLMDVVIGRLVQIYISERDAFKERLRQALLRNNQRVPGSLVINNEQVPSVVKNWFRDYFRKVGTEGVDKLKEAQYFSDNINFKKLPYTEQKKLKELFHLFERLGIPSLTPEGIEDTMTMIDDDGNIFDLQNGRFVLIAKQKTFEPMKPKNGKSQVINIDKSVMESAPVGQSDPLALLKKKYQDYRLQRQVVLDLEDQLVNDTKGEPEMVKRELAQASRQNEKIKVIACLKILARQGSLATALSDNLAWHAAVQEYIQKKYASQYKPDEINSATFALKSDPGSPAGISELLQYLLREKLEFDENDSALVGVEIGQLMGVRYEGLAYGDQETGNFTWAKNYIKNSKLVSEND